MFFSGGTGGTRGKVIRAAERNIATKEITPRKYTAEQLKQIKLAIQAKNASYNKNLTSSEYTKFLKDVAAGRKLIIQAFSDMVNDDVNNLRFIAGITYSSSQATNHMVRALAAAVGIEQGVQITDAGRVVKGKGVSEHAFQSGGFGNSGIKYPSFLHSLDTRLNVFIICPLINKYDSGTKQTLPIPT